MPKCKLLPLSKRPMMKRPQRCTIPSSYPSSPPALLSTPTLKPYDQNDTSYNYHQQTHPKRTKTSSSSSSCETTTTTTTIYNKNRFPIWKGGSSISTLPKTILYQIVSSPMTHFICNENDLIEKGITPNDICAWIVQYVVSISAMGQYRSASTTNTSTSTSTSSSNTIGSGTSKNEVSATIQTMNDVVFSISLYQMEVISTNHNHSNSNSPSSSPSSCPSSTITSTSSNYYHPKRNKMKKKINLLIDIERIRGDTIEFHWIVKSIFDMIHNRLRSCTNTHERDRNDDWNLNSNKMNSDTLSARVNLSHPNSSSFTSTTSNEESNTKHFPNTMETISTLLKKDRLDANLLGMESLDFLLNGYSSNDQMTYLASKAVLSASDVILDDDAATTATCCQLSIRDEILNVVNLYNDDEEEDEMVDEKKNPTMTYRRRMKHLTFKIFANALSTMVNSSSTTRRSELEQIIQENIEEWKDIFTKFVEEMKKTSTKNDNNGTGDFSILYEISRCIQILVSLNVQLNLLANHLDVCSVMAQYHQEDSNTNTCTGLCAHRDLGKVSKSIVSSLNQCK